MCGYLGREFTAFIGLLKDSSTHKYVQNHCSGKTFSKHIQICKILTWIQVPFLPSIRTRWQESD